MHMRMLCPLTLAALLCSLSFPQSTAPGVSTGPLGAPRIQWLPVGNPGNPDSADGVGHVNQPYLISRYEVTNAQYAAFLNAKATLGDPLALYNPEMGTHPAGGIARTGAGIAGAPYHYETWPFMGNKPVNFVSFFDAARYANWMSNGMGDGATESGSYLLLGGTAVPLNGDSVVRGPGASVVLPTEHEWYKAGHYKPTTFSYTAYATGSSAVPTPAAATPTGGVANPGPNVVNYATGADWGGLDGNVVTVGGAGPQSESWYGCADMNGNVSEWNETIFPWSGKAYRINRGGDYKLDDSIMQPGHFGIVLPAYEASTIGFRVVRTLP